MQIRQVCGILFTDLDPENRRLPFRNHGGNRLNPHLKDLVLLAEMPFIVHDSNRSCETSVSSRMQILNVIARSLCDVGPNVTGTARSVLFLVVHRWHHNITVRGIVESERCRKRFIGEKIACPVHHHIDRHRGKKGGPEQEPGRIAFVDISFNSFNRDRWIKFIFVVALNLHRCFRILRDGVSIAFHESHRHMVVVLGKVIVP